MLLKFKTAAKFKMRIQHNCEVSEVKVAQLCLSLCNPIGCSLPGFSVHGIFQARIWSGLPFVPPGDLPNPGTEPESPALPADSSPSDHHGGKPGGETRGQQAGITTSVSGLFLASGIRVITFNRDSVTRETRRCMKQRRPACLLSKETHPSLC